jgi:amidase
MPDATAADVLFRPVSELAGLVRSGQISSRELVQTSLDRIDQLNPRLNAFVDVFAEDALAEADTFAAGDTRPFAGVPIAIKNNRAIRGRRMTLAANLLGDYTPDYDHNVVRRFKQAGFVIVGTTTLPEWGILPVTETARFGPTRNPWDTGRTPGGSSGGSAAAAAAGMVPLAHGNDGGGSTRIPAACCGLVGLKPQRGRISVAPEAGYPSLVQDGVLTHTVADTAALLDVLAGYEPGDAAWAPPPEAPFGRLAARDPGRMRIALTMTKPLADAELDPVCEQAARDAGALLESLGHDVEEVEAPWSDRALLSIFSAVFGPLLATSMDWAASRQGREPVAEDMEPLSWAIYELSSSISAAKGVGADIALSQLARRIAVWALPYDAIVTPALAEAPVTIGTIDPTDPTDPMGTFARSGRFTPYTALSNVTGSPAISLPLYARPEGDAAAGVPLGVQLIGRPAGEGALLALAAQLESAHPWHHRRPAVS